MMTRQDNKTVKVRVVCYLFAFSALAAICILGLVPDHYREGFQVVGVVWAGLALFLLCLIAGVYFDRRKVRSRRHERPEPLLSACVRPGDAGVTMGAAVFLRLFQITVVVPGSIAAAIILLTALSLPNLTRDLVVDMHYWAETSVCTGTAPLCSDKAMASGETVPRECKLSADKLAQLSNDERNVISILRRIYIVLVVVAIGLVELIYPGRRFVGLGGKTVSAYVPRPRTSQDIDSPSGN